MDDLDYKILIDLYESRNLTKVAQKHYFSQPAITKRIQHMEEELNCRLMIRWQKGVVFTTEGEAVMEACRNIVQQRGFLETAIQQVQGVVGGSLLINCSLNYARYRLPSALKTYSDRYPQVDVTITADKSKNIYESIQMEKACVAIARGERPWDGGRILLSHEPMCLVCSHENSQRPLDSYSYIGSLIDGQLMSQIERWSKENNLAMNNTKLWVDDVTCCREMARCGVGWCVLPKICLDNFDGHMKELQFADGTPFTRNTYALFRKEYQDLPQVRLFLEVLEENQARYSC